MNTQRRQDSLKRRWQEMTSLPNMMISPTSQSPPSHHRQPLFMGMVTSKTFPSFREDDLVSIVSPPAVTVVLEGRSICQRISLHKHGSYHSLAKALRQMFVDIDSDATVNNSSPSEADLDLTNAIPGHLVAYEDVENDLLLAGDLNWKDFVRVAKRIRILPAKVNSRKGRGGA